MRVRLDEETLKAVASHDPGRVLLRRHRRRPEEGLRSRCQLALVVERKETEISALFAALGALLALLSAGLSVWWFGRVT